MIGKDSPRLEQELFLHSAQRNAREPALKFEHAPSLPRRNPALAVARSRVQSGKESEMNNDVLTTIEDEALEAVSGGGIGATIGGALDSLLGGAFNLLGKGLTAIGGLISGIGGILVG
jgi:hypothetical protein